MNEQDIFKICIYSSFLTSMYKNNKSFLKNIIKLSDAMHKYTFVQVLFKNVILINVNVYACM